MILPRKAHGFFSRDDALLCPDCGHQYMHHERIEIFERGEDALDVTRTIVDGGQTQVDRVPNAGSGNPSARRHGVRNLLCL